MGKNELESINATYDAFAMPIACLRGYADHTCVRAVAGGTDYDFRCYGRGYMSATNPSVIHSAGGSLQAVSYMVNRDPTPKAVYDDRSDNCGIIYLLQGVCHNMANRILMTATNDLLPMGTVKAYNLVLVIYGYFGHTIPNFRVRYMAAINSTAGLANPQNGGPQNEKYKEWIMDANLLPTLTKAFDQAKEKIEKFPVDKCYKRALQDMLQMELYGLSTPQNRLAALYLHTILNGSSDNLQDDIVLRNLLDILQEFLTCLDVGTSEIIINDAFMSMNKKMYDSLGKVKYKQLFGENYDSELCLVEESEYRKDPKSDA